MANFDLERFIRAQADIYGQALAELRRGRKQSHWMWFVFPQIAGLGRSPTAQLYAIASIGEASAYLAHPLLGERLRECTQAVIGHAGKNAEAIFGSVDAAKFRSSMTLFETAADDPAHFTDALRLFYGGDRDAETLRLIRQGS